MPMLNITLSGAANSSATGMVTDPAVLSQIKAVMRHVQDMAQTNSTDQAQELADAAARAAAVSGATK